MAGTISHCLNRDVPRATERAANNGTRVVVFLTHGHNHRVCRRAVRRGFYVAQSATSHILTLVRGGNLVTHRSIRRSTHYGHVILASGTSTVITSLGTGNSQIRQLLINNFSSNRGTTLHSCITHVHTGVRHTRHRFRRRALPRSPIIVTPSRSKTRITGAGRRGR